MHAKSAADAIARRRAVLEADLQDLRSANRKPGMGAR